MAYERVQFSLSRNQPRLWKIAGLTAAISLVAGIFLMRQYPESLQVRNTLESAVSESRSAKTLLGQAQDHLKSLEAMKASGKTIVPMFGITTDISIDQAIKEAQVSIGIYKAQIMKLGEFDDQQQADVLSRQRTTGMVFAVIGFAIGGIIWRGRRAKAMYEAAKSDLVKRGIKPKYQVGNALIDPASGAFAFVDMKAKAYDLYFARDILGWEHQWVNTTTASTNVWGNNFRASTSRTDNALVFKTSNPAKPLYKVRVASHRIGEEWMARLDAIISG